MAVFDFKSSSRDTLTIYKILYICFFSFQCEWQSSMIFKLANSYKLDAITLFQAISGFTNPIRGSGLDGCDLQLGNFS